MAVDLAKLSLWLATLARDHEFTFLDHALKSGDSLVGLTQAQIAAAHWDTSKPGLPLFRQLVKDRVAEAMKGRAEIQAAPDDTARAIQEQRHKSLEARLKTIRRMGDAVIAAFFAADKPKAREAKRAEVESWLDRVDGRRHGTSSLLWLQPCGMARIRSRRFIGRSSFRKCLRARTRASMRWWEIRRLRGRTRSSAAIGKATWLGCRSCIEAHTAMLISLHIFSESHFRLLRLEACFGLDCDKHHRTRRYPSHGSYNYYQ